MITSINPYTSVNNKPCSVQRKTRPNFSCDSVSFAGAADKISKADNFFIKIAQNKYMKKILEWADIVKETTKSNGEKKLALNSDKLGQFMMIGYSLFLQTNHVINIMKNKEMPQDRKEVLAVNNVLTFVIPTIGALTIDGAINRGADRFQKYLKQVNGNHISVKAMKGVKQAKTLFVFTMMYKYASTLIAMPFAESTTDFLRRNGVLGSKAKEHQHQTDIAKSHNIKKA